MTKEPLKAGEKVTLVDDYACIPAGTMFTIGEKEGAWSTGTSAEGQKLMFYDTTEGLFWRRSPAPTVPPGEWPEPAVGQRWRYRDGYFHDGEVLTIKTISPQYINGGYFHERFKPGPANIFTFVDAPATPQVQEARCPRCREPGNTALGHECGKVEAAQPKPAAKVPPRMCIECENTPAVATEDWRLCCSCGERKRERGPKCKLCATPLITLTGLCFACEAGLVPPSAPAPSRIVGTVGNPIAAMYAKHPVVGLTESTLRIKGAPRG